MSYFAPSIVDGLFPVTQVSDSELSETVVSVGRAADESRQTSSMRSENAIAPEEQVTVPLSAVTRNLGK